MSTNRTSRWERLVGWLRRRWRLLLVAVALIFGGIFVRRRKQKLGRVLDELAVERARRSVAELRARRDTLAGYSEASAELVADIDRQIEAHRILAVRAHEGGRDLTGQALLDAYAEMGF